jgi:hypothetical protein
MPSLALTVLRNRDEQYADKRLLAAMLMITRSTASLINEASRMFPNYETVEKLRE